MSQQHVWNYIYGVKAETVTDILQPVISAAVGGIQKYYLGSKCLKQKAFNVAQCAKLQSRALELGIQYFPEKRALMQFPPFASVPSDFR